MLKNTRLMMTCTLLIIFSNAAVFAQNTSIVDYRSLFIPCYDKEGKLQIAIRTYRLNNILCFLLVNPYTLSTQTTLSDNLYFHKIPPAGTLRDTSYIKALYTYSAPPYKLANYGLIKSSQPIKGMFLTIDMCPSSKKFEKNFFESLIGLADKKQQPIPIAISITGLWMLRHPEEFAWLADKQKQHKLAITWINHSFTHLYYPGLALEHNFTLIRPAEFDSEVMKTEKILLETHELPSVFFRFPGLVANKNLVLKLHMLGLIPVGAHAWLAKKEIAKEGDIILVHGNSNEPQGIKTIMPLLHDTSLHWLPLVKSLMIRE